MAKLKQSIYIVLAITFITALLFVPAYVIFTEQKASKTALHLSNKLSQSQAQLTSVLNAYDMLAKSIYDNIINTPSITALIRQANAEDDAGKAKLRQELYTQLLPLYKNLQQHNVRQLHFHLKNSISFLRFHRPSKFGDSLEGVRYSIDKVNRTMRPEFGFEEGRIFNGFRHIFPIVNQNKFAGTVEISYSFNAIKTELDRLQQAHYSFIIQKRLVDEKVWKNEQNNYLPSELSNEYLLDKSVKAARTSKDLTQEDITQLNQRVAAHIHDRLNDEQPFIHPAKLGESNYLLIFIPILNVENKQVAYAVVYEKSPTLDLIEREFNTEVIIALFIALSLAVLIVLYYLSQRRTAKALHLLATTDQLTGLANRNHLNIVLDKSIKVAQRYQLPLSLIFFDVDHFKQINDNHGHDGGDTVLTSLSTLLSHHLRTSDLLARWGGEEFMILLPETERKDARLLAEKLRHFIEDYKFLPDLTVTCSFGVTQLRNDDDEEALLKRLDNALYAAKENGRNIVVDVH